MFLLAKGCIFAILSVGTVAQLVEQRTENPCVGGSIPPGPTIKPRANYLVRGFLLVENVENWDNRGTTLFNFLILIWGENLEQNRCYFRII